LFDEADFMNKILIKKSGFTVVELIIVISIIGILFSFSSGSLRTLLSYYKLRVSTDEIVSYLRKTKQLAISKHARYGLELISSKEFGIYKDGETGYIENCFLEDGILASHSRSNNKTTFSPLGTAYSGTITLSNSYGKSYNVIISSSGKIRVEKDD
jgi:prepilin-type N-terminal cleavage/methylation domain-containing protein